MKGGHLAPLQCLFYTCDDREQLARGKLGPLATDKTRQNISQMLHWVRRYVGLVRAKSHMAAGNCSADPFRHTAR